MDSMTPNLTGHRGLRGDVLVELKKTQPITAKELADRFGVSANAVRRHLKELEAEGLVSYGREQRGTGAPTYAYRLTPGGETLFPNQYEQALKRLIDHVIDAEGRDAVLSVVEQQYADLRSRLGLALSGDPEQRLRSVASALEDAGFMAESVESEDGVTLSVHNCAIHAVANCLPEVCDTEIRFLEDVLGAKVTRRTHIMEGCNACQYKIDFGGPVADQASPEGQL